MKWMSELPVSEGMKITILCDVTGDIFVTLPSMGIDSRGTSEMRVGRIERLTNIDYSVIFQIASLSQYDKSGFSTRLDAVEYEQSILNAHLVSCLDDLKASMT